MFNQSYEVHITPLVINSLGGEHTQTHTQAHIQTSTQKQFQETRHAPACGWRMPGLIILVKLKSPSYY